MSGYLSVGLNLVGRSCLVVGGGAVASRRVQALLEAGSQVTVVTPEATPSLKTAAKQSRITLHLRAFETTDVHGAVLVVAATADAAVNREVAAAARSQRIPVNCADDPSNCDFVFPAVVRRGGVQIAIHTGGRTPALARHLREQLERLVPAEYAQLAEILGQARDSLRREGVRVPPEAWQAAIDDRLASLVREGRPDQALALLRSRLTGTAGAVDLGS